MFDVKLRTMSELEDHPDMEQLSNCYVNPSKWKGVVYCFNDDKDSIYLIPFKRKAGRLYMMMKMFSFKYIIITRIGSYIVYLSIYLSIYIYIYFHIYYLLIYIINSNYSNKSIIYPLLIN